MRDRAPWGSHILETRARQGGFPGLPARAASRRERAACRILPGSKKHPICRLLSGKWGAVEGAVRDFSERFPVKAGLCLEVHVLDGARQTGALLQVDAGAADHGVFVALGICQCKLGGLLPQEDGPYVRLGQGEQFPLPVPALDPDPEFGENFVVLVNPAVAVLVVPGQFGEAVAGFGAEA